VTGSSPSLGSEEKLPGRDESKRERGLGQKIADFRLVDVTTNRPVALYDFDGKKAAVLAFIGVDCPVSNLYVDRLVELNREYADKGVVFLGIDSIAGETASEIAAHAKEFKIDFPVLKDQDSLAADRVLAERSGEVILLDSDARIRYRGAIDDQYQPGTRKPAATQHYLKDAIEDLLAHRPVGRPSTPAVGCLIPRESREAKNETANVNANATGPRIRPASPELISDDEDKALEAKIDSLGPVTYARDVARIIQNRCQSCHREGQVAPFSLKSYDDARRHAAMIQEVVDNRRMPPWHADPRHGTFSNDRRLSVDERAILMAWVEQGTPLGDPKELPEEKSFPEGWGIGTPDLVFEMPETYQVPAQGVVDYVHFRVPSGFREDRWIQAAEAVPGDRSVVHHIIVYVDDHSENNKEAGRSHLCGYAPGDMPSIYPAGTAKKIPAGSDLIFELHYTPNGKTRTDRSKLGLIFASKPVTRQAYTVPVYNDKFSIPPNEDNVAVSAQLTLPNETRLLAFMPHMHLRGKDFRYSITRPGGDPEVLLSVPAYDFGWQSYYILAEPLILPQGTRIDCLAHFDNSSRNPYNPDPNKLVKWGQQTFDEMMIGYIDIDVPVGEAPASKPKSQDDKPEGSTAAGDTP
jgi:peroxiredoxin